LDGRQGFRGLGGTQESAWSIDVRDNRVVAAGSANGQLAWVQFPLNSTVPTVQSSVSFPAPSNAARAAREDLRVAPGSLPLQRQGGHRRDGELRRRPLPRARRIRNDSGTDLRAGIPDETGTSIPARLQPAFPNPLVRQSVFAFDLPRAQGVRIGIYDVAGRLVRMLASRDFPAGQNRATGMGPMHTATGSRPVSTTRSSRPAWSEATAPWSSRDEAQGFP
jgi:hypothetical protein